MRIAVSGSCGQILRALQVRARAAGVDLVTFGRPEADFSRTETVASAIAALKPAAVINAAAYTAVDLAESHADIAMKINVEGARAVAQAAAAIGVPIVQLSTDYVFDGRLDRPYREDDATAPLSVYGRSKRESETAVAEANADSVILRTSWVFSPFGRNFVLTMLALAEEKDEVRVVMDQVGAPTYALDLADGIFKVVRNLAARPQASELRGIFHLTNAGETNWADFASCIFDLSARRNGPSARVVPISARDYPTAATRPANSRLDNGKILKVHGVALPDWRAALDSCMTSCERELKALHR